MFHLLFSVYVMILYKKYLWYISMEYVFEKINFGLSGSAGLRLGRGFQTWSWFLSPNL